MLDRSSSGRISLGRSVVEIDGRPPGRATGAGRLFERSLPFRLKRRIRVDCAGIFHSHIIAEPRTAEPVPEAMAASVAGAPCRERFALMPYLGSLGLVAAALMAGLALQGLLGISNVALVFLTAILTSAVAFSLGPSLFACVASILAYDVFFLAPAHGVAVNRSEEVVTLVAFTFVAAILCRLTAQTRAKASALAIDRRHLAQDMDRARLAAETEHLSTALLASISHDLRAPLTAILGSATSLRKFRRTLGDRAQEELIATIQEEAERLKRFIANLLDMTRIEAGAVRPHADMVELRDIVSSALDRAHHAMVRHRIAVEVDGHLPAMRLDPVLLEQVLFNLFDNAAKYAPVGTEIRISAWHNGEAMLLQVMDEGPGVPPGDLDRIFEKFYRVQAGDGRRDGIGLGLAICKGFVEAMGGTIEACNRAQGHGAIFAIAFPASTEKALSCEAAA
jgi:K+-sensing histidine kinase KdpD